MDGLRNCTGTLALAHAQLCVHGLSLCTVACAWGHSSVRQTNIPAYKQTNAVDQRLQYMKQQAARFQAASDQGSDPWIKQEPIWTKEYKERKDMVETAGWSFRA